MLDAGNILEKYAVCILRMEINIKKREKYRRIQKHQLSDTEAINQSVI
jgi:hypothetical protein